MAIEPAGPPAYSKEGYLSTPDNGKPPGAAEVAGVLSKAAGLDNPFFRLGPITEGTSDEVSAVAPPTDSGSADQLIESKPVSAGLEQQIAMAIRNRNIGGARSLIDVLEKADPEKAKRLRTQMEGSVIQKPAGDIYVRKMDMLGQLSKAIEVCLTESPFEELRPEELKVPLAEYLLKEYKTLSPFPTSAAYQNLVARVEAAKSRVQRHKKRTQALHWEMERMLGRTSQRQEK